MPARPPSRLTRPSNPGSGARTPEPTADEPSPGPSRLAGDAASRPRPPESEAPRPRWYRRRVTLVGGGVLVLLLVGLVWVVVTGLIARGQLEQVRAEARGLQTAVTGGTTSPSDLDARIADIAAHAHNAHRLTTGPAWAVTAAIPWLGRPAEVTRGLTATADDLAGRALPALGRVAGRIEGGGLRDGGRIDLTALRQLAPDVTTASQGFDAARTRLTGLPSGTWLEPPDPPSSEVTDQVGGLATTLDSADTALQIVPTMLGATTPQRYFVAFQNNAEARGTGGLPGAFGIVTATRGVVSFERFESDDTLVYPRVDVDGQVDFGADQRDYLAQYALDQPFGDYRETNESPHFPYAAQIWAAMWKKYSGETVTGAVAVDPTALGYLLQASGPVRLADGSSLTADDIVAATQKDVYAKFPSIDRQSTVRRKEYLLDVASRTEKALLGAGTNTATLVRGASRAATERRLLVWSADPEVEAVLARTAIGGALPETTQPFGLLTVLNVAGTKLDYYLDRRVSWTRTGCGATRDVTVRITVTNRAPASGLPPYVTFRADDPPKGTPVGSNRWVVEWYGTAGGLLQSVSIDGERATVLTYQQRGHPVFRTLLETPPGGSHTVVLHLREPAGTAPVTLLTQPLVRPLNQSAVDDSC